MGQGTEKRPIWRRVFGYQLNLSIIVLLWRWEFVIIFKAFHWKLKVKQKCQDILLSRPYLYSLLLTSIFPKEPFGAFGILKGFFWEAAASRKRTIFISTLNVPIKPLRICPYLTLKLGSSLFPSSPRFPIPAENVLVSRMTENANRNTTQTAVWWYIVQCSM